MTILGQSENNYRIQCRVSFNVWLNMIIIHISWLKMIIRTHWQPRKSSVSFSCEASSPSLIPAKGRQGVGRKVACHYTDGLRLPVIVFNPGSFGLTGKVELPRIRAEAERKQNIWLLLKTFETRKHWIFGRAWHRQHNSKRRRMYLNGGARRKIAPWGWWFAKKWRHGTQVHPKLSLWRGE